MKPHYTAFDRWVARMRHRAAERHITPNSRVCDVGCGVEALFLRDIQMLARFRVGLDWQEVTVKLPGVHFVQGDIRAGFPFGNACFDHVTLLAVLEHLENPRVVFQEAHRILVPGGSLIVTWPSALVDPLLDVLMALHMVSRATEADKHQPRKSANHWVQLVKTMEFEEVTHRTFEFGLNNLLVARRP